MRALTLQWSRAFSLVCEVALRALHTQAKNRDHDIVRAQKKVSKRRPKTPPKSWSVVRDPQV
jgi:hypothetical protein